MNHKKRKSKLRCLRCEDKRIAVCPLWYLVFTHQCIVEGESGCCVHCMKDLGSAVAQNTCVLLSLDERKAKRGSWSLKLTNQFAVKVTEKQDTVITSIPEDTGISVASLLQPSPETSATRQ